jgi:hypothetical protein
MTKLTVISNRDQHSSHLTQRPDPTSLSQRASQQIPTSLSERSQSTDRNFSLVNRDQSKLLLSERVSQQRDQTHLSLKQQSSTFLSTSQSTEAIQLLSARVSQQRSQSTGVIATSLSRVSQQQLLSLVNRCHTTPLCTNQSTEANFSL